MAISANAPIRPPVSELSLPMMAFCTVLESDSSTTRSNGLSCANSRLPKILRNTTRKTYTITGRRIFFASGAPRPKMAFRMPLETTQSGIRFFLPMPIMQDFRGFDKTYRVGDVFACRKAVDVLWMPADFGTHRLIPKRFERAQTSAPATVLCIDRQARRRLGLGSRHASDHCD